MLTTIRDDQNRILAVCEWWCVDAMGRWDARGPAVWVEQLEISSQSTRSRPLIRRIITDIAVRCPWARGAYWDRRDRVSRSHVYVRKRLVKAREEVLV